MEQLKSKMNEYATKEKISDSTIQQLEQTIKAKEWVIKNLKKENNVQRSRESCLLAQMAKLNQSIEAYESKFHGKDVDVPMLLIQLKEYVERTQDLECQVRRLTNQKLNELVLLSRPRLRQVQDGVKTPSGSSPSICESHQYEGVDNGVSISVVTPSNVHNHGDNDEEVDSLDSDGTEETMAYLREGDVLGNILDTLEMERGCCPRRASQPKPHPT